MGGTVDRRRGARLFAFYEICSYYNPFLSHFLQYIQIYPYFKRMILGHKSREVDFFVSTAAGASDSIGVCPTLTV